MFYLEECANNIIHLFISKKGINGRVRIVLRHFVVRRGQIPAAVGGRLPCNQPPSRSLGAVHGDYR